MIVKEKDGIRLIILETEHLDALNTDEIKRELMDNVNISGKTVLNLEKISFIDSSGLGVILTVFRAIKEKGGTLAICSIQEPVKILFKLVRLSHMINLYGTEPEALAQI